MNKFPRFPGYAVLPFVPLLEKHKARTQEMESKYRSFPTLTIGDIKCAYRMPQRKDCPSYSKTPFYRIA
jgi:hypothetical protein